MYIVNFYTLENIICYYYRNYYSDYIYEGFIVMKYMDIYIIICIYCNRAMNTP